MPYLKSFGIIAYVETFSHPLKSIQASVEEWACELDMFPHGLCFLWQHNTHHYSDEHKDSTRGYDFKPLPNSMKDIKSLTQSYYHKSQAVVCTHLEIHADEST